MEWKFREIHCFNIRWMKGGGQSPFQETTFLHSENTWWRHHYLYCGSRDADGVLAALLGSIIRFRAYLRRSRSTAISVRKTWHILKNRKLKFLPFFPNRTKIRQIDRALLSVISESPWLKVWRLLIQKWFRIFYNWFLNSLLPSPGSHFQENPIP